MLLEVLYLFCVFPDLTCCFMLYLTAEFFSNNPKYEYNAAFGDRRKVGSPRLEVGTSHLIAFGPTGNFQLGKSSIKQDGQNLSICSYLEQDPLGIIELDLMEKIIVVSACLPD